MFKNLYLSLIVVALSVLLLGNINGVRAAVSGGALWDDSKGTKDMQGDLQAISGLSDSDPRMIVASIVKTALGFLGIIAVVIIVIGGYEWMTSGGSDEKAKQGRTRITNGVIGLAIILAAYGIANLIINIVITSVSATPPAI